MKRSTVPKIIVTKKLNIQFEDPCQSIFYDTHTKEFMYQHVPNDPEPLDWPSWMEGNNDIIRECSLPYFLQLLAELALETTAAMNS